MFDKPFDQLQTDILIEDLINKLANIEILVKISIDTIEVYSSRNSCS